MRQYLAYHRFSTFF